MASIMVNDGSSNGPSSIYSPQSTVLTIKSQSNQIDHRKVNKRFHHPITSSTQILKLVTISLILLSLGINSVNCVNYDEQFLEQLPLQSIVSTGTELRSYTSEAFTRTCFTKIDYKSMCAEFGPKCEFKFEWSYPESLLELIKSGFDARIRIENDLPVRLMTNPDMEVYASHLIVANIGYSHQGIWSCNFKFINQDNGKLDSWQHSFSVEIIENGVRGAPCMTNDHCSSFNCTNDVCICDAEEPITVGDLCLKAPKLGETCLIDDHCEKLIEDAECWCSASPTSGDYEECPDRKTCQCPPSYIAVSLGLGRYRCLKKARIGEHCYRSQQCEAVDSDTYCSFKSRCSCRSGRTCSTQSIRTCNNSSECSSSNEYCGNGRCQVVKDLHEPCETTEQCERHALCSPIAKQCVCAAGYKVSPIKMTCIPKDFCSNDLECEKGYCDTESESCIPGVPLSGRCSTTKQCQAYDTNSYCDGDTNQCACGVGYYANSQGDCLLKGKCRFTQDCQEQENGICYYEECIYTKRLHAPCQESRQCFLQTSYSYCEIVDLHSGQAECSCLNGFENFDDDDDLNVEDDTKLKPIPPANCKQWHDCNLNRDCSKILNSYCDHTKAQCSCNDGYSLNIDGSCYKKSLSPADDKDSFWSKVWTQYYIYIIIGAALLGFLISLIICCCCKLCQKNVTNDEATIRGRNPRRTREGYDRPVTGVYIAHQPTAPPPSYISSISTDIPPPPPPSTISRNF